MTPLNTPPARPVTLKEVDPYLGALKLAFIAEHYGELAQQAAHKQWSHLDSLGHLVEGEALLRRDRATQNRLRLARFPVIKTREQFRWDWPTQINRALIQHHFTLRFLKDHRNVIYLGGVGLGKPQPGYYPSRSQCFTGPHHLCR
jgi:DNA replication protein DnaC